MDVIRDSFFGQALRFVTKNRVLLYPEEREGFSWAPLVRLVDSDILGFLANERFRMNYWQRRRKVVFRMKALIDHLRTLRSQTPIMTAKMWRKRMMAGVLRL
jgi:hypothetical protein